MPKLSTRLCALLFFGTLSVSLASCELTKDLDWSYSDYDLENAYKLKTSVETNNGLKISLSSDREIFKSNLRKKSILFVSKASCEIFDYNYLSTADLKQVRIQEYDLSDVTSKSFTVTLKEYEKTDYYVIVDAGSTTIGRLAIGTASLTDYSTIIDATPSFDLEEDPYYANSKDPSLLVSFSHVEVKDMSKVELGEAFSDLTFENSELTEAGDQIKISTTGFIKNGRYGTITLEQGFFEDVDYDVTLYAEIDNALAYLDQTTLALEGNTFSFNVISTANAFISNVSTMNAAFAREIDKISIADVSKVDAHTIRVEASVTNDISDNLDSVIDYLHGVSLTLKECFDDLHGAFPVGMHVNYPKAVVVPAISPSGNELRLSVKFHNAQEAQWEASDISFIGGNLVLEGEAQNATQTAFVRENNGFEVTYALDSSIGNRVEGVIVTQNNKLKTLWGAPFVETATFDSTFYGATNELGAVPSDIQIEEKAITADVDPHDVARGALSVIYAAEFGASVLSDSVPSAVGSLASLLGLWLNSGSTYGDPTIADVLAKLDQMDKKLDDISAKVDALSDLIVQSSTAELMGIDKILYNQYRSNWDTFNTNYVEPMDNMIRDYLTNIRSGLLDVATSEDDFNIRIVWAYNDNNELVVTLEDPHNPGYDQDGNEIEEFHSLTIPASYFQPARDAYNESRIYPNNFPVILQNCFKAYLQDNPMENLDEQGIYYTLMNNISKNAVTRQEAMDFYNLFVNYTAGLSGKTTGTSKLTEFYSMMDCYFNFEKEEADSSRNVRANVAFNLVKYTQIAHNFAMYSGAAIDFEELAANYKAVHDYIQTDSHAHSGLTTNKDFSYVTGTTIRTDLIHTSWNMSFSNTTTFKASFKFYSSAGREIAVNNTVIFSEIDLSRVYRRYLYLFQNGDTTDQTFSIYLQNLSIIPRTYIDQYYNAFHDNKGEPLIDYTRNGLPVLVSYGSLSSLSSEKFNIVQGAKGDGSYVSEGTVYTYKTATKSGLSADSSYWSGQEVTGKLVYLNGGLGECANYIDRYARYDESHSYWRHDEHWGFNTFSAGRYCLCFFKN